MVYYNENDKFCVQGLQLLIDEGLLPNGHIDSRSIEEVTSQDLQSYKQCHFFAGIGGWPLALAMAGWPESESVWTGSCPCQPFSLAANGHNKIKGVEDARHLLPKFSSLIRESKVERVFGEQVSNAISHGWLDELHSSLENYTIGANVLSAKTFGSDHERKRLFWVAHSRIPGRERHTNLRRSIHSINEPQISITSDYFSQARQIMENNQQSVLSYDGVSLTMERNLVKGYGNAIVPQVAAKFIHAYMEIEGIV